MSSAPGAASMGGSGAFFGFLPTDNGSYVATVRITDDDGDHLDVSTDDITVNNVVPVAITYGADAGAAPGTPLARLGSPEEDIAPVVLFLASKDAQFLTGYSLTPDGGMIIDSAR